MKNKSPDIAFQESYLRSDKVIFIADIISGILLLLFLYTSLSKLAGHGTFKNVLKASPLLHPVAGLLAWLLPAIEIAVVIFLFIPSTRKKGVFASFVLISAFTIYLFYMLAVTPNLPCSCGGVLSMLSWRQHIIFNLVFIVLSLLAIHLYKRAISRKRGGPP